MIRVTSTLIVHRPERILYYLPEYTDEIEQHIADGVCPPALEPYLNRFGTYDEAGVFFLTEEMQKETGMRCVVGIEYRKDDSKVELPQDLPSVVLPACNIIIQDIAYEGHLDVERLEEIVAYSKSKKNDRSQWCYPAEHGLAAAFSVKEKLRIIYEVKLINEPKEFLNGSSENYSKEELYNRSFFDFITGFPNWSWMWECLMTYYLDGIKDYAFVHFDIKDYKMINELYNHYVGNDVLVRITQNIEAHKDWIYYGVRCHNDNFALMIKDMPEEEIREKLSAFFEEISTLSVDPSYRIYYRCGVVNMRYAMNAGDTVADYAKMAQATGTKINATEIHFYTSEMHENILWGKQLKAYLDTAIRLDEFLVYLQPKMDINKEHVCGAEALIRWNYKHKGLMPPYRFIPHFEADDSIIKVDEVVLHKVCARLKEWKEKGYPLFPVSVNLSRKHMEQADLTEHLVEIVDSYGVDHSLIEFELTESAAYDNQKYMVSVLHELKSKGFLISMDDFGTGYSSFGLLKDMPLDTLKIDKSFVDLIAVEEEANKDKIILGHIISMAKDLGIHCLAEGAEEYAQVEVLRKLGCETIQGYYYSKPIDMESFEEKYMVGKELNNGYTED